LLAERIGSLTGNNNFVIGLARGGIVIADQIAKKLKLPLDILVIRKIPSPVDPELGVGALAPDGVSYIDWKLAARVGADEKYINRIIDNLSPEIKKSLQFYRKSYHPVKPSGKTVILADDGAATGGTIRAAIRWLKAKSAARIIPAIPVAPYGLAEDLKDDNVSPVFLQEPQDLTSVGSYYRRFDQVDEKRVLELIGKR